MAKVMYSPIGFDKLFPGEFVYISSQATSAQSMNGHLEEASCWESIGMEGSSVNTCQIGCNFRHLPEFKQPSKNAD